MQAAPWGSRSSLAANSSTCSTEFQSCLSFVTSFLMPQLAEALVRGLTKTGSSVGQPLTPGRELQRGAGLAFVRYLAPPAVGPAHHVGGMRGQSGHGFVLRKVGPSALSVGLTPYENQLLTVMPGRKPQRGAGLAFALPGSAAK